MTTMKAKAPTRMCFADLLVAVFATMTIASLSLAGERLPPDQCGNCHEEKYREWIGSKHRRSNVECGACHGDLHSGGVQGCRQCHGLKHHAIFEQWPAVQRFDPPNSSDYVCTVCHQSHTCELDEHRQACVVCHDSTLNNDVAAFHADLAEIFVPTENDGYVLRESLAANLLNTSQLGLSLLAMPVSLVMFCVGTCLLFPFGLGCAVLARRQPHSGDRQLD